MREVLTHDSFYEASKDGDKAQGNGRYVFAGMTVFKGQVAGIKKLRDAKRRQSQAEARPARPPMPHVPLPRPQRSHAL